MIVRKLITELLKYTDLDDEVSIDVTINGENLVIKDFVVDTSGDILLDPLTVDSDD